MIHYIYPKREVNEQNSKMKKKMAVLIMALVMILSMSVPALAGNIQPRSPTCIECGGETIYDWVLIKEYPCRRCGKIGCGMRYWGWRCTDRSCLAFVPTSEMGYACGG